MNLRKSIKVLCAKTNTSQRQLAEHLGITEVYLSRLMKDNRFIRENRLRDMAEFYQVPLSEFIAAGE